MPPDSEFLTNWIKKMLGESSIGTKQSKRFIAALVEMEVRDALALMAFTMCHSSITIPLFPDQDT